MSTGSTARRGACGYSGAGVGVSTTEWFAASASEWSLPARTRSTRADTQTRPPAAGGRRLRRSWSTDRLAVRAELLGGRRRHAQRLIFDVEAAPALLDYAQ